MKLTRSELREMVRQELTEAKNLTADDYIDQLHMAQNEADNLILAVKDSVGGKRLVDVLKTQSRIIDKMASGIEKELKWLKEKK